MKEIAKPISRNTKRKISEDLEAPVLIKWFSANGIRKSKLNKKILSNSYYIIGLEWNYL